jgi:hypothetical protein
MYSVQYFGTREFVEDNKQQVEAYADLRVKAVQPERALLRVFGTEYADECLSGRACLLENNGAYRVIFDKKFEALDVLDMVTPKMFSRWWLEILHSNTATGKDKAEAIKHLALIHGITIEDMRAAIAAGK